MYVQEEHKDDTDTQSCLSPIFLCLAAPTSFLSVRAEGWDGRRLSARGSDNDTVQVTEKTKETHRGRKQKEKENEDA